MANLILYTDLPTAQLLCDRLDGCKGAGDTLYTSPVMSTDGNSWLVEILDKHLVQLTVDEFSNLIQAVPAGFFIIVV